MDQSTIYVVDDNISFCRSLSYVLEMIFDDVKLFHTGQRFLQEYDPNKSACLLLDIRMPDISGLQLYDILQNRKIKIPVIYMTGHGDIPMAVRAMKKGAFDFMTKPFRHDDLLNKIRKAIQADQENHQHALHYRFVTNLIDSLSPREFEVLEKIADGDSNKVIAADLKVSQKTIEYHRAKIIKKLNAKSLPDLVKLFYDYLHYKMN